MPGTITNHVRPDHATGSELPSGEVQSTKGTVVDTRVVVSTAGFVRSSQIYAIVCYHIVLLGLAIALMVLLIWKPGALNPPLLVVVGFVAAGAVTGSVLYQMRMLFRYYVKDGNFDSRWLAKYISAPWEAVALALVVLSLLQGGGVILGGQKFDVKEANAFAAFGIGALVGFGIRDVVGWLGGLAHTMFQNEPKDETRGRQVPPASQGSH